VERDLVCCCEAASPEDAEEDVPTTTEEGGALEMEQEVRFVGLLARDCHSMASKCLALAILERTLETYLNEELVQQQQDQDEDDDDESSEDDDGTNSEEEALQEVPSDDEEDDDWKPGSKRRSRRLRKKAPPNKRKRHRTNTNANGTTNTNKNNPTENEEQDETKKAADDDDETWERLEQFFAAGGLLILNRWLTEATKDEPVPAPLRKPLPTNTSSTSRSSTKPSATRPLILPILRFLEHIPFDKKVVMDSKINKQIRKLEKQVDGILKARARDEHRAEDLENWTTEQTSAETDALDHVKEAVDAIKTSWVDKGKHVEKRHKFGDPLGAFKETMRERLGVLTQYETGSIPAPDWLDTSPEETTTTTTKKKGPPSHTPKISHTQELAANERRAEREGLQQRLRAVETEHRERVAKVREQLRKRKDENAPSNHRKTMASSSSSSDGKIVSWKDGLKTQTNRNRNQLEEVFVFVKDTPASGEEEVEEETGKGDSNSNSEASDKMEDDLFIGGC
jgi:hypothetical protein